MTSSLVGSEMCIRDSFEAGGEQANPGDMIMESNHSLMFPMEALAPLGGTGEGQNMEPKDTLVEWSHKFENPVKE
eukprot:7566157-Prorocentrum_lima.AAC.1